MIVAVDGPAASGKGTIARALARHYRLPHLDTGLLYRAVAATVADRGADPRDPAAALAACDFDDAVLAEARLRDDAVGLLASIVSAHPAVREALLERQRRFARQPGGAVLDGRDIGTVIAPDADAKLFVTAAPEVRADRRHAELAARGDATTLATVLADIRARDERDSARATAPLVRAEDAVLLDTSTMGIEESIATAVAIVEDARSKRQSGDIYGTDLDAIETRYRAYIACLNERAWDRLDEFVCGYLTYNGRAIGRDDYRDMLLGNVADIPDLVFAIDRLVASQDGIAARLVFDCHPAGRFMDVAVDGRRVTFAEHVFYRFQGARIADVRSVIDKAAIEAQAG